MTPTNTGPSKPKDGHYILWTQFEEVACDRLRRICLTQVNIVTCYAIYYVLRLLGDKFIAHIRRLLCPKFSLTQHILIISLSSHVNLSMKLFLFLREGS